MEDCSIIRDMSKEIEWLLDDRMHRIYFFAFLCFCIFFYGHATDQFLNQTTDYLQIESIPSVLYGQEIILPVLFQCSPLTERLISLSIEIDHVFFGQDIIVFQRYWYCRPTADVQVVHVPLQLHQSMAYTADNHSNLYSWPVEVGRLNLVMYEDEEEDDDQIIQEVRHTVRFLPVHQRPKAYSLGWNPLLYKANNDDSCSSEPDILRLVDYPLVLTSGAYGKHVTLPSFSNYQLRWEKQAALTQAKFSLVFWIYIDEYCHDESPAGLCAVFQHLTFNKVHLTPGLSLNRKGQLIVHLFGDLNDAKGEHVRTFISIPKKDWCRLVFTANENEWSVYLNCLQNWTENIITTYKSLISYYWFDEMGTYIIGGSDSIPSFRGIIAQMDIYRTIALKPEQLPKKLPVSMPSFLPNIISQSDQCQYHRSTFEQCREQLDLFHRRIQEKKTCRAFPFRFIQPKPQSLLIRTWREQSNGNHYRIFRALQKKSISSINDLAEKLFQLITHRLNNDDLTASCKQILTWSEQASCYGHPTIHSLLATFYKYGLCGMTPNSTQVVELLMNGALLKDRMSLLALGHRHYYGLDDVQQDYDAAYVYYREMADISKTEFYNPKPDEVIMEWIRLTNDQMIESLTFDQSDTFYWLQDQARRGVSSAQQSLGTLLYLGSNGLTRNIPLAVEYFRLAADQYDTSAMFMYGIVRIKGQGIAQNATEGIRYLEEAVRYGYYDAELVLGYHAYKVEKNYVKAAKYWQDCYNRHQNTFCAYNLGRLWTTGHYPFNYQIDHAKAWTYYSYASQRGQIDSKIMVAHYAALADHPVVGRNSELSAMWARTVADESSAVGSVVRRALKSYRDGRWQTSLVYYLQAAVAGSEIGYFNAGYLCHERGIRDTYSLNIDCIKELLQMSLMMRDKNLQNETYDLLTIAEYYQTEKNDSNQSAELYLRLFDSGDPRGLFNLAQMEENDHILPINIWNAIGVPINKEILTDKYRRLQTIYGYCRSLNIPRQDESYIPCTLCYVKISILIFLREIIDILTRTIPLDLWV